MLNISKFADDLCDLATHWMLILWSLAMQYIIVKYWSRLTTSGNHLNRCHHRQGIMAFPSADNFTGNSWDINYENIFKNYIFEIIVMSPGTNKLSEARDNNPMIRFHACVMEHRYRKETSKPWIFNYSRNEIYVCHYPSLDIHPCRSQYHRRHVLYSCDTCTWHMSLSRALCMAPLLSIQYYSSRGKSAFTTVYFYSHQGHNLLTQTNFNRSIDK